MKKYLLLLCTVLFCASVSADEFEKKYGRGVVHIQPDSFLHIEFFSSPDSAAKASHRITILRNAWNIGTHYVHFDTISTYGSVPSWFSPLYYIPTGEYARIDIVALDSANGFYSTGLTDEQGKEVWVKKSNGVSFMSWFQFFSSVAGVEPVAGDIILFKAPDAKSQQVNYTPLMNEDERSSLRPLEIKGHWMKVELTMPTKDPAEPWQKFTGWIRWRDDKEMLVRYNLTGC